MLDLGCGLGLLAFWLREHGLTVPIHGLDYDLRKVSSARRGVAARARYEGLCFEHHDARGGLPPHHGNVTILDILQFFTPDQQRVLLCQAADRVAVGGKLVIRSGLRDESLRFRCTVVGDWLAKATFWMKAAPTHYPTADCLRDALSPFGEVRIAPLHSRTPFNNHLIVLERNRAGA